MNNPRIKTIESVERFIIEKKDDDTSLTLENRVLILKKIKDWILTNLDQITTSLKKDLNKSETESLISEVNVVLKHLTLYIKTLKRFFKEKKVRSNGIFDLRAKGYYTYKPIGVVLLINPYNYPFQLSMLPLVTSIAAGNFTIIKNSPKAINTSRTILKMLQELNLINIISFLDENAGKDFLFDVISKKPDLLFFTGSKNFGEELKRQANSYGVKTVLELGSACPVIVDESANIHLAAKRIVWAKLFNVGQTCIAPNSIFCDAKIYDQLVDAINSELIIQYNVDKFEFTKIIDTYLLDKIVNDVKNLTGTDLDIDKTNLTIKPKLVKVNEMSNPILFEEIFGPILFITPFTNLTDFCKSNKNKINNALALYLFSENSYNIKNVSNILQYGSICINELLIQASNIRLPFGGIKTSGIGKYHGKFGLIELSNLVSVVKGSKKDLSFRYFNKIWKYKKLIKILIKR